jgi:glycosyltransferase involved in cell wall biosynthesis
MKILLIASAFNKHGGISRYVAELAERFVKEHETHLLTIVRKPHWLQIASNAF